MKNIIILGFKASGKTTFGKKLSKALKKPFFDTDLEMQKISLLTPRELLIQKGEEEFNRVEREAVFNLSSLKGSVIATGGRTVLDEVSKELLKKNGVFVFLDTPKGIIFSRLMAKKELPPFLQGESPKELFDELYEKRVSVYRSVADHISVSTNLLNWGEL